MGDGTGALTLAHTYGVPALGENLNAEDFNGDGHLDLLYGTFASQNGDPGNPVVLLGHGDGTFGSPITSSSCQLGTSLAVGDVNGDHKLDLVSVGNSVYPDSLFVCLGNGDGTFAASTMYNTGQAADVVVLADFNGDGNLDAAVSGTGGIAVLFGKGDGTFVFASRNCSPFLVLKILNSF